MATFSYYRYSITNTGLITGSPVQVEVNDADGFLTDPPGGGDGGDTFMVVGDGATYTFLGGYPAGSNPNHDGDFTASTPGPGSPRWFFSSDPNLPTDGSYDANSQTGFANEGTVQLTCFLEGTCIATEHGETPVESLKIGDRLRTADGDLVAVKWIGRQSVHALFGPRERSYPVCITAGALSEGTPHRELFVSPDHALLIDGLLINASALVNGQSIRQVAQMPARFDYFHIEVEGHRVILAEGAPTETFVDNVSRRRFHNWAEYEALYPNAQPIQEMDVPRVSAARLVPNPTRARLLELASRLRRDAQVA